ncbi:hypothetical protein HPP92_019759 [Vanilla planifolia]|uniref:J domain-containing protein n=1 Tax=Vanilla planifolia TaxID=51239 RepID=A0A835UM22_VANPL|nr:hypothetical protein HPP92_019759 [Vanilla planifolia]
MEGIADQEQRYGKAVSKRKLRPTSWLNIPSQEGCHLTRQRPIQTPSLRASSSPFARRATIGERRTTATFYDLLRIPASGSLCEINEAYGEMARKYHPDASPPERKEEKTIRHASHLLLPQAIR